MTTYRLMDGASGRPGVGSTGTQPPSAGLSFSGNYLAGLVFQVTAGGLWFTGYWWWVPATNSQTGAQKFALWQVNASAAGKLVAGSAVTSGTLTAGAWNFVALPTPLLLAQGFGYVAATGFACTTGFPDNQNQFGSGNPYSAGITNGPLQAYSSTTGSNPVHSNWLPQSPFATPGSSDPSVNMPVSNDLNDLLWLDVQVTDTPPSGASYRLWPNLPDPLQGLSSDTTGYLLSIEFSLSTASTLKKIWHYSPPTAAALPTRCAIWDVATTSVVTGTDTTSPAWKDPSGTAAAAGDGWVYCDLSGAGVTLAASHNYKVATFHASGSTWMAVTSNYWSSGPGGSGLTQGVITAPSSASATPGQGSYATSWAYPSSFITGGEQYWLDVEVTPVSGSTVTGSAGLAAAPALTAAAVLSRKGQAALTAAPVLATAAVLSRKGQAALTASPSLTTAAVLSRKGQSAFTAAPVLAAAAIVTRRGQAALTAPATLHPAALATSHGQVSFTAPATLAAAAVLTRRGLAALAAPGLLATPATVIHRGAAGLSAPGLLAAAAGTGSGSMAALHASAALAATAVLSRQGAAALAAPGQLAGSGIRIRLAASALTAGPVLLAQVSTPVQGTVTLSAGAFLYVVTMATTASLENLWDIYQARRDTAEKAWANWRMMKAIARTDGTAGFLYGQAYEAEQAADLAYEAYLAALRTASGSRG